jgi:hypothetical protein
VGNEEGALELKANLEEILQKEEPAVDSPHRSRGPGTPVRTTPSLQHWAPEVYTTRKKPKNCVQFPETNPRKHDHVKNGVFWDVTRVTLVRTDVSEKLSASFIRVTRIVELGTLAVISNRRTLRRNTKYLLTIPIRRNITEDAILHSHFRENLKSYTTTCSVAGIELRLLSSENNPRV